MQHEPTPRQDRRPAGLEAELGSEHVASEINIMAERLLRQKAGLHD